MNADDQATVVAVPAVAMVIDDDPYMSSLLGEMLSDLGVGTIIIAANGDAALQRFAELATPPELLVCDLCMPGMDGIEFLRHMASHGYRGGMILLSGMAPAVLKAAERLAHSYAVPLLGTLAKPVTRGQLGAMICQRHMVNAPQRQALEDAALTPDELRQGLREGCVRVYYQPKVALGDRSVVGAECLVRWQHAERGILGPHTFVPVAEQHELIHDLTVAVLSQAAGQARAWRDAGHAVRLAVNISMDNLNRLDLPEVFSAILAEQGLTPETIILEVTETRLTQNLIVSLDILTRLRIKGFDLSLDDFGTGYSTMENLKQLPFTELKVDRAFVHGASEDEGARSILESSVRLGRSFQLKLVAEGVETQQDWDLVANTGCDEAQGYFIAKPMPAEEFMRWHRRWNGLRKDALSMEDKPVVMIADDERFIQELVTEALTGSCRVIVANDGEEALEKLAETSCDLLIVDVEMPRLDGYETCRRLKDDPLLCDIPVLFLSGHDAIEDRLKGLEVGGEDYMTKPFNLRILEAKVKHLLALVQQRQELRSSASFATGTAMTAMTSMSEMGMLLDALKRFNTCATYPALAEAVLAALATFDLQGVVQLRVTPEVWTYTSKGPASPLDISVIEHLAGMDRIVQFRSRMSITYPTVSILVNNMPLEDPDRCGRLRDHIAMLAEAAEARLQGISATIAAERRGLVIAETISQISGTLAAIDQSQRASREARTQAVAAMLEAVEKALLSVALTDGQEEFLANTVRNGLERVVQVEGGEDALQNQLSGIVSQLKLALQ